LIAHFFFSRKPFRKESLRRCSDIAMINLMRDEIAHFENSFIERFFHGVTSYAGQRMSTTKFSLMG